jgi:hypothetical protein
MSILADSYRYTPVQIFLDIPNIDTFLLDC